MTDRTRSLTSASSFNSPCYRSHSCRERTTANNNFLHNERIQLQPNDSFSPTNEYIENVRTKLKTGYNQLMRQKLEKAEEHMNQRYEEERQLSQRKFRKAQIANEKFRLQTIDQIIRERDTICEEKLAAQRSLYNRLLEEQAQRFHYEKTLQSYENLNVEQLKDRLTRVENSNYELQKLIHKLIQQQQPNYKSSVYIPPLSRK